MKRSDLLIISAGLLIGAGLAVFVFLGLDIAGGKSTPDAEFSGVSLSESAAVGSISPDFELSDLGGGRVRLKELRGKIVVINFWATWCEPCKIEMPIFEQHYHRESPQLEILAVNFDEPAEQVQKFAEEYNLSFPVLLDPGAEVQKLYRVVGYPTTFIVDEEGVIAYHHIGLITDDQLTNYLAKIGEIE